MNLQEALTNAGIQQQDPIEIPGKWRRCELKKLKKPLETTLTMELSSIGLTMSRGDENDPSIVLENYNNGFNLEEGAMLPELKDTQEKTRKKLKNLLRKIIETHPGTEISWDNPLKDPLEESKKTRAQEIRKRIQRFTRLLEDYSDEIPRHMISGQEKFKVSNGWLQAIVDGRDEIKAFLGISDKALDRDIASFHEELMTRRREWAAIKHHDENAFLPTTPEEIDTANDLLRRLIELLEQNL